MPILLRRFPAACGAVLPAGAIALLALSDGRAALAYSLTFLLVAADFWWMAKGLSHLLGEGPVPSGVPRVFLAGLVFRSLLLLLGIYGIFQVLPKESLGVLLGIGGPLLILAAVGLTLPRG